MTFLISLAEWNGLAFAAFLLLWQIVAYECGFSLGGRAKACKEPNLDGVGVVVGGMLALLTFVLALTLSFSNSRFEERRAGTLTETNAIGTAWLRAEAVGGPRGEQIARLLEQYTQLRKDYTSSSRDPDRLRQINLQTNALQSQIWGNVTAVVRERSDPVTASLMASVNDAFDSTSAIRFAFAQGVPPQFYWLLFALTLLSMASLGYQIGLRGKAPHILVCVLVLMWTAVLVEILDLASPRLGAMRTDVSAYSWTQQGFSGGVKIPPLTVRDSP